MKMLFYMKMYLDKLSYPISSTDGRLDNFWIHQIQNGDMSIFSF
jgi:hypothetical protein